MAKANANTNTKPGRWRETRRKGVPCLISPDGRIYYGTAREVRDAALTPFSRKRLADALRWAQYLAREYTPEERKAYLAQKRREWIRFGAAELRLPCDLTISARDYLLLNAGMRLVGYDSFQEFVAELVRGVIEALLDVARLDTGKRKIPLTRYERAALERIEAQEAAARAQIEA